MTTTASLTLEAVTPMLASPATVDLATLVGKYAFDEKLDGIRALAAIDRDGIRLRSRSGRSMTDQYPDLVPPASYRAGVVLDGEIVALNGSFQDIAGRDRAVRASAIARGVTSTPAKFVAFDVLWTVVHGDMRGWRWEHRREVLETLDVNARFQRSRVGFDLAHYDALAAAGGEGVVAKRIGSRYESGRSRNWVKFKTVASVTCIAAGYENGTGRRASMGAIVLAMLNPSGQAVIVGSAGSGFTNRSAEAMRLSLEAVAASGNVLDLPIVEVQCLGVTRDGKLRQPVFKGVRTDLSLVDAPLTQLDSLNRA